MAPKNSIITGMDRLDSDAILCFMGGVTLNSLETHYRPNTLSIGRILQIYSLRDAGLIDSDTPILVGGAQVNYHTGLVYPDESMSETHAILLSEGHDDFKNVVPMKAGFDTASEAGAMLHYIREQHPEWRRFTYNSDTQHYPRIEVILRKFFGPGYSYEPNPLSNPANGKILPQREELIISLFQKHFARYEDGAVPYVSDEQFYHDNKAYFTEQRSIIESTSTKPEDMAAYDGGRRGSLK